MGAALSIYPIIWQTPGVIIRTNDETLSDIQKFGQMSHPASNYEIEAARRKKSLVNFMEMAQLIIYGLA